jgi:hypothetical protein
MGIEYLQMSWQYNGLKTMDRQDWMAPYIGITG